MGLHRLDEEAWLEVDRRRAGELLAKARLLEDARTDVLAAAPGALAACEELAGLIEANLTSTHPGLLFRDRGAIVETTTSLRYDPAAMHPLELAARIVQEDLCVLERREGHWRLTAACVCFPSRWRLADKLGATLAEIHGPVPGFDRALGSTTATFFDRLRVERPVWRLNWTLLDTPELHLPSASSRRSREAIRDPATSLWFRVERQTLRRLPASGAIVFTIRTYVTALGELLAQRPGAAAALRDTLVTVPVDVASYKGWSGLLDELTAWLDLRASDR